MSLALYLPEMQSWCKDSRLGPLKIEVRILWKVGGEGVLEGWQCPRECLVWGWLPSSEPTLSTAGLLSWTSVPFAEMTSFPYQAPATSHSNGFRPQQDHPDFGRHHLPPPARGQLSKGRGGREPGSSCPPLYIYLVLCLGQPSLQPHLGKGSCFRPSPVPGLSSGDQHHQCAVRVTVPILTAFLGQCEAPTRKRMFYKMQSAVHLGSNVIITFLN